MWVFPMFFQAKPRAKTSKSCKKEGPSTKHIKTTWQDLRIIKNPISRILSRFSITNMFAQREDQTWINDVSCFWVEQGNKENFGNNPCRKTYVHTSRAHPEVAIPHQQWLTDLQTKIASEGKVCPRDPSLLKNGVMKPRIRGIRTTKPIRMPRAAANQPKDREVR